MSTSNLKIFENPEFGSLRTVEIDGAPWLVGKDVAGALGYGAGKSLANAVAKHVDGDDKGVTEMVTPGGKQKVVIINESGLYSLILSSKLPTAKKFKRWVTSEVLPAIRKDGGYIQTTPDMTDEEIMARAVLIGQKKIQEQAKRIEEMRPKEIFADAVTASETSILVGDLAKILKQNGIDIGQKRLFQWMRDHGYLIKYGSSMNVPTQYSMDLGLMEVEEKVICKDNDRYVINKYPKVTGKGQNYFVNKFLNDNMVS